MAILILPFLWGATGPHTSSSALPLCASAISLHDKRYDQVHYLSEHGEQAVPLSIDYSTTPAKSSNNNSIKATADVSFRLARDPGHMIFGGTNTPPFNFCGCSERQWDRMRTSATLGQAHSARWQQGNSLSGSPRAGPAPPRTIPGLCNPTHALAGAVCPLHHMTLLQ